MMQNSFKNGFKKYFVTQTLQIFVQYILPLPSCIQLGMDQLGYQAVWVNHEKFWKQMTHILKILCFYHPPEKIS